MSVQFDVGDGGFEDRRHVAFRKLVAAEGVEKTGLTAAAVAHHDYVHSTLQTDKTLLSL